MKLFTKAILNKLPTIGATSELDTKDCVVQMKLFNPMGSGTWYITEYDPETKEAFGFANLGDPQCAELGYIPIDELESVKLPFGMKIERDRHFEPTSLDKVIKTIKSGGHI